MMNVTALLFFNKNPNQHTHEHKCCAPKLSFSWWHVVWCHHYQISFKRLLLEILSRTHKKTVGEKSWNLLLWVPLLSLLFHGTVGWLAPSASALWMGESSLHPWGAHSDCWTISLQKGLNTLHLASCFWSRWTYVWTIRFGILITFSFIQTSRQKNEDLWSWRKFSKVLSVQNCFGQWRHDSTTCTASHWKVCSGFPWSKFSLL